MPKTCSNGCSLNWFTPSEFFQFSQLSNKLVSLKNANDIHKSSIWSGFAIKNWIEDQFQSSPKLEGIWTMLRCIFVPNLEVVNSIGGGLWHGQAENGVNFYFGAQFDLEGQGQLPPKTISVLTNVFCTSGPNLVIVAWTGDELSRGQTWRRTDRLKDGRRQRQYPEAKTGLG